MRCYMSNHSTQYNQHESGQSEKPPRATEAERMCTGFSLSGCLLFKDTSRHVHHSCLYLAAMF